MKAAIQAASRVLRLLVVSGLIHTVTNVCRFPSFLRHLSSHQQQLATPSDEDVEGGNSVTHWVTELRYSSMSSVIQSRMDVVVLDSELVARVKFAVQCPPESTFREGLAVQEPCYQTEIIYRKSCLADLGNGKYKVLHSEGLTTYTTCMKFIQRNLNVVQLFLGPKDIDHSGDVCSDQLLQRQEWPWIAAVQQEWSFCPFVGGFDFRAFIGVNKNKEKVCPDEWRPSRLEAECVQGDGLLVTFPSTACNPFTDRQLDLQLHCWASWKEENHWFILAASPPHKLPQYVLRLPLKFDDQMTRVNWYTSPVCPTNKRTGSTGHTIPVTIVELALNRSEPGLCYDDSPICQDYARDGRCTNSALYQYANYCKRSCGLCNLLPSPRPECRFPAEFHGEWYYFESDRSEKVTVTAEHITFSILGEFVCKSKHWSINYYKLFSVYVNGCRPRYTCLHLERDSSDNVRFQISTSSSTDNSFDLCSFKDDSQPLGARIHSAQLKTLLQWSKMKANTCGLEGSVHVFTHPDHERRTCWGKLSDWNHRRCGSEARLRLQLYGRCDITDRLTSLAPNRTRAGFVEQEYICTSFVKMDAGYSVLITKTSDQFSDTYSCWAIKTYPERGSYAPWQEVYLLPTALCTTPQDAEDMEFRRASLIALTTESDSVDRPCGQIPAPKQSPSSSSSSSAVTNDHDSVPQSSGTHDQMVDESDYYVVENMQKDKYVSNGRIQTRQSNMDIKLRAHFSAVACMLTLYVFLHYLTLN